MKELNEQEQKELQEAKDARLRIRNIVCYTKADIQILEEDKSLYLEQLSMQDQLLVDNILRIVAE